MARLNADGAGAAAFPRSTPDTLYLREGAVTSSAKYVFGKRSCAVMNRAMGSAAPAE